MWLEVMNYNNFSYEKFYIPYDILCRFDKKICILDVDEKEITWTIDNPIYKQNNIKFYTKNHNSLSNFMNSPCTEKNEPFYQCYSKLTNKELKLKPKTVELLTLNLFSIIATNKIKTIKSNTERILI